MKALFSSLCENRSANSGKCAAARSIPPATTVFPQKNQARRTKIPAFFLPLFLLLASCHVLHGQQRMLFRDIPPHDPRRVIIRTVLNEYSMQSQFTLEEWRTGHYGGAWARANQYFPNQMYYSTSQQYFMHHHFTELGRLEMQVYDSQYLRMSIGNFETFQTRNIVNSYNQMLAHDAEAAASFSQKLGDLESYFRDNQSLQQLRKMLGSERFQSLLDALRKENYHMFAGALMHEGMHSKLDNDQLVKAIQDSYAGCTLKVQWDELRAYMCEINYHNRFYSWATRDIDNNWKEIDKLLKELEKMRKKPKPDANASDKDKQDWEKEKAEIEKIKARIKAHIALIRLRLREIWQLAQRMLSLVNYFREHYMKADAPMEERNKMGLTALLINDFVNAVRDTIIKQESMIQSLENYLRTWNKYSGCDTIAPPDSARINPIIRETRGFKWPAPPVKEVEEIKKGAEREVGKIPGPMTPGGLPGLPEGPRGASSRGPGTAGSKRSFYLSASCLVLMPDMAELNGYIEYLNRTWIGEVPAAGRMHGLEVAAGMQLTSFLGAEIMYRRFGMTLSGPLGFSGSLYTTELSTNTLGATLVLSSPEILTRIKLFGGPGLFFLAAAYKETENAFVTSDRAATPGWNAFAGLETRLTDRLSASLIGEYQHAHADDFEATFFMPGNPPVSLDFSGFMLGFRLAFRF